MKTPLSNPNNGSLDMLEFLSSFELFKGCDTFMLQDLIPKLETVSLKSGNTLMKQGERGDCIYFIINGRLRVFVQSLNGEESIVRDMGRGEVVGEMAILSDEPRSATVRAVRHSKLMKLSSAESERFFEKHPRIMLGISKLLIKRLRSSTTLRSFRTHNSVRTIAVFPTRHDIPITEIISCLNKAFAPFASVKCISSESIRQLLHSHGQEPDSETIIAWLNEQENHYDYLIYELDHVPTEWTQLFLAHTDRILIVGKAGTTCVPGPVETKYIQKPSPSTQIMQSLVLIHPDTVERPKYTADWLSQRTVCSHHHVHMNNQSDFDRIARLIMGRSVGLVLGGGGARGFAHIGVIRALEESGIPIDFIGGTSIGAIISALYAIDRDTESIRKLIEDNCTGAKVKDFTFPIVSMMAGKGISRLLNELIGDVQMEDLWLRCFCVSSNLSSAQVCVHENGSLTKSIRASISLPGIFPPVFHGTTNDLLVDGGILNILPIDIMNSRIEGGQIIAVNVSNERDVTVKNKFPETLSGWKVLGQRFNPFSKSTNIPNILNILLRTTELASIDSNRRIMSSGDVDLYLRPPVAQFGTLQFDALDDIIDVGYNYAKEMLSKWQYNSTL